MRVGWRNRDTGLVEVKAGQALSEPLKAQLDRLSAQVHNLNQQLDPVIARRNESVAQRASHHVASIVAAAEKSAAEIRARAENEAAAVRERLLTATQAEVEVIRSEVQADAARIRAEAYAQAARARDMAIAEATAQIQEVCSRLSDELQRRAAAAIARIRGRARSRITAAPTPRAVRTGYPARRPAVMVSGHTWVGPIAEGVKEAVDELQNAATVLEQSLRNLGGEAAEPQAGTT